VATAEALQTLSQFADRPFDAHITFHLSESFAAAGDHLTALRLLDQAWIADSIPTSTSPCTARSSSHCAARRSSA
jgi:hypothetical protein